MTRSDADCSQNTDPRKLVREGTDQVRRALGAPDPARVPVDERRLEHDIVFASAYAQFLNYFDLGNAEAGDWQEFFTSDVSAQLAVVAIEDVAVYRSTLKALQRSLEDPELPAVAADMIAALGAVFDCLGSLALRLDTLQRELPLDQPLRATLGNLIRSQLSPALQRLIGYYKAGDALGVVDTTVPPPDDVVILGRPLVSFNTLITGGGLHVPEWPDGVGLVGWAAFAAVDPEPYKGAFGPSNQAVDQVNHLATHNLFTAIGETFLAVYARVVDQARAALRATFDWDGHEPHYALFLAFVKLLDHARAEANGLTAKHLDFYYRKVLRLRERPAMPGQAHVLVELAKHVDAHLLGEGTLLKAGKDDTGADAHFTVNRDLVANKATIAELKSVYRHPSSAAELPLDHDRIFATPVVDVGKSWHPFAEKVIQDGTLTSIAMPPAEVGFAIASHLLWLAEGKRLVTVDIAATSLGQGSAKHLPVDLLCRLTTEKGWHDQPVDKVLVTPGGLQFDILIDGNTPPITPYDAAVHEYGFATSQPVLLVILLHRTDAPWDYAKLASARITAITLRVSVEGVKTLALSNDNGPIDASKPFLVYGAAPNAKSSLVIGSKEVFQKSPSSVTLHFDWTANPDAHGDDPTIATAYLGEGVWNPLRSGFSATTTTFEFDRIPQPHVATPDLSPDAPYSTASRAGFIRLQLSGGFGTDTYPVHLAEYIAKGGDEPNPPIVPKASSLALDYDAAQAIDLAAPSEAGGRFFHLTPFGHAAQQPAAQTGIPLVPQFLAGPNEPAEGELYIGVRGLAPPQNLALLFQVDDGTANPLAGKPANHVRWTYLRGGEWVPFADDAVVDGTDGLLASGIVTFAVPADATTEHTLLTTGVHWIRSAVASHTDAVCRLVRVAAQALQATYAANSRTYELPPGTITKVDPPDAAVKGVDQPFPTFGGRPVETTLAFATRISERLRHKDRAIALWDYEHVILEAFPGIFQARCLNHTQFEPSTSGKGIYRELAPGHVTVVTTPDLPNPRDPLRPFTSLRVLGEIERFLKERTSCFATLHVRNPQFEEVRVDLRVRFRGGVDETFHVNGLRREITEFLSPWAYRRDARPTFNGRIYKSVVVNFVEERAYVDYVSDVKLFHLVPGKKPVDLDEIVGSRAISILVSVPPQRHRIYPIRPDEELVPEQCACAPPVG